MQILHPTCTYTSSNAVEPLLDGKTCQSTKFDPNLLEKRDKIERTEMEYMLKITENVLKSKEICEVPTEQQNSNI